MPGMGEQELTATDSAADFINRVRRGLAHGRGGARDTDHHICPGHRPHTGVAVV